MNQCEEYRIFHNYIELEIFYWKINLIMKSTIKYNVIWSKIYIRINEIKKSEIRRLKNFWYLKISNHWTVLAIDISDINSTRIKKQDQRDIVSKNWL